MAITLKSLAGAINNVDFGVAVSRGSSNQQVLEYDVMEAGNMSKCKDLHSLNKGQVMMARPVGQSISKKSGL